LWINPIPKDHWGYTQSIGMIHKISILIFVVVFFMLGWLGMQPVTPFNAELGLRGTEVYFLFFVVLWYSSKPRSSVFAIALFAFLVIAMIASDFYFHGSVNWLGFMIPVIYLVITLFGPIFTGLDKEKAVPERVTG